MKRVFKKTAMTLVMLMAITPMLMAQTNILTENFTATGLPSGWTRTQAPISVGWEIGTALTSQFFQIPSHGRYAASNDDRYDTTANAHNKANLDYLITPALNLSAHGAVALTFSAFFSNKYGSTGTVEIRNGTTANWNIVHTMLTTEDGWETVTVDLSNFAGFDSVQVAFHHNDNNKWADGFAIDDVNIFVPKDYDVVLTSLDINEFYTVSHISPTNVNIKGMVTNNGSFTLASFDLSWQADNGTVYTRTISGINLSYSQTYNFNHTDKFALSQPVSAAVKVWVSNPNGTTDGDTTNNELTTAVSGLGGTVVKKVLVEEFSGAWCQFCPDGAVKLEAVLNSTPTAIGATIHGGGTDAMKIPAGEDVADEYVSGWPSGLVDRYPYNKEVELNRGLWQAATNARLSAIVPVVITMANTFDDNTRQVTVDISAFFLGKATGDLRFNVYIVENNVTGTGSGYNQVNYYNNTSGHPYQGAGNPVIGYVHEHVVRAMLGGAWGTSGIIGSNISFGDTVHHQYTYTLPAGWKKADIKVVGVVQVYDADLEKRPIINAVESNLNETTANQFTITYLPVGIAKVVKDIKMELFPNPTNDRVFVRIADHEIQKVTLTLSDLVGNKLTVMDFESTFQSYYSLDVKNLPAGTYFVSIDSEKGKAVKKFVKLEN